MKAILEVVATTVFLVFVVRLLYSSQNIPFIASYYAAIFAILFIYVPVMVLWWRKRKIDFLDNSPGMFFRGVLFFVVSAVIIFPPYFLGSHFWMVMVYGRKSFQLAPFPDFWKTAVFQLLLVALPEEFFFRGYMQGALNTVFKARWRVFGAQLGFAWLLTAAVFALSHSFVNYQWWHFSIFFPALVFGWLREKTGSITAPILFHALSNIASDYVARCYY